MSDITDADLNFVTVTNNQKPLKSRTVKAIPLAKVNLELKPTIPPMSKPTILKS